ncbi:MAG: hypothetical protein HY689_01360 [Chloroflexi bacterium]|nr:hypothetical protein [Chloroflexota bacterium]
MWRERIWGAVLRLGVSALLLALAVTIGLKLSTQAPASPAETPGEITPLVTLRTPQQDATEAVAQQFLAAWSAGRYREMYQLLSKESRRRLSEAQFTKQYRDLFTQGTITAVAAATERFSIRELSRVKPPGVEEVPFTATFTTAQMGRFSDRNFLQLVQEQGQWRVQWSPGAMVRDLEPKGRLILRLEDGVPTRGKILDRAGEPLASTARIFTIGLVPGRMNDERQTLAATSDVLGIPQQEIKAKYAKFPDNWLIPLGEVPVARRAEVEQKLGTVSGLVIEEVVRRVYPRGSLAASVLGFVGQYNPYNLDDRRLFGTQAYRETDWIGRSGIERWGEEYLVGLRGGTLVLRAPDGGTVRLLGRHPQREGKDLVLTLDSRVQQAAEEVLGEAVGAVVVLDIGERSVLAAASSPTFDPNYYSHNPLDQTWRWLIMDPRNGFHNRALASTYPVAPVLLDLLLAGGSPTDWLAALASAGEDITTVRKDAPVPPGTQRRSIEASPLQVASLLAAVAGDGQVRSPVLVRQVVGSDGRVEQRFEPKDRGSLPLSADALRELRERLRQRAVAPEGMAYDAAYEEFLSAPPVAGLAGGFAGGPDWFAGYAPLDAPRYAVVVLLEIAGQDTPRASQIARALVQRLGP